MEAAIGVAKGLIGGVLDHLGDEFVEAYGASSELGLNSREIKNDHFLMQGLLCEAQRRGISNNPGLEGLLLGLGIEADKAEDALDELHYFIIQDQLDGTRFVAPDLGDSLWGRVHHIRHAIHHNVGNLLLLQCFSCWLLREDPHITTNLGSGNDDDDGPIAKFPFDRVSMSEKIKSVILDMHSQCERVTKLLNIIPHHGSSEAVNLSRPLIGSISVQHTLFGRSVIFEKTIHDITSGSICCCETLSVLPVVGLGGIGKSTFAQHLFNNKRIQEHFLVRVWVCVSTTFDVLKLSQQILSCIPATENEGSSTTNETINLNQLQTSIARRLKSRNFIIVLDDIWKCSKEDWENLLAPLMKGEANGNMVLVTTRFPSIADMVKTTDQIALKGLYSNDFLNFFEVLIFGGNKPEYYQDNLADLAKVIARKLKGSPLAAKTVSQILKKDLTREHWKRVIENNEWQKQKDSDDIMPSLRISYNYLPFHLKKCFSYLSLFPEDYRFKKVETTYFWIAIGIIDKDENYMEELVENGFLMKEYVEEGPYYVLHDLLHELSRSVSSQECLIISSSVSFRADDIPKSIRHLSITMEDGFDAKFSREIDKLRSKVDIANLRTLMIFSKAVEKIDAILKDNFKEIVGLRVLFIVVKSPETLPCILSKLIHLRYLKISAFNSEVTLPRSLSRFYHLELLDLKDWHGSTKFPKGISCGLVNLRHFFAKKELCSSVPEVGKMKCLTELNEFGVKKESAGFELTELGELTQLGGELCIYNLKTVATKKEAMKAKLASIGDLKKLRLVWGDIEHRQGRSDVRGGTTESTDVLDGLEPHPNLRSLVIQNHGGSTGPRWLCGDITIQMLKSLHLEGVSWDTFPPFGQLVHLTSLVLIRISGLGQIRPGLGGVSDKSFLQLELIVIDTLSGFTEWIGAPNSNAFSRLEKIICEKCPNLVALPFLQDCSDVSYNQLQEVVIRGCPKLSMPPMPHTSTLTRVELSSPAGGMLYFSDALFLREYSGALALQNVGRKLRSIQFLGKILIKGDQNFISLALFADFTSLTSLELVDCTDITVAGFNNPLITAVNLKVLKLFNMVRNGHRSIAANVFSELVVASRTKLLLPAAGCFKLETLMVDCQISAVLASPVCNLFATTLCTLEFWYDNRVERLTEEEEEALQLLTSLKYLSFYDCLGLPSLPQGLHSLPSLLSLYVGSSPKIQSLPKGGLPTSLRSLTVRRCSPELKEQVEKLKGTNPGLRVHVD